MACNDRFRRRGPRACAAFLRSDDRVVVGHPNERRFFDEDVFAGGKRLQRQVEMKTRRHRNDDRISARVVNS